MREILFRGKDKDDKKWYEGTYLPYIETTYCFAEDYAAHPNNTRHYIVFDRMTDWGMPNQHYRVEIIPETLGQYTGLKDKNGKRIFEGDIFQCKDARGCVCFGTYPSAYESKETHVGFYIKWIIDTMLRIDLAFWANEREIEVIGNIHDNPELMEEQE